MLFLTETILGNYADDNNLFNIGEDINKVKNTLAKDFVMSFYVYWQRHLLLKMYVIKTARKELFWR